MLNKINIKSFFIFSFLCLIFAGCSKDNTVTSVTETETLIYQRDGIIESFGGDCSAVQVRTSSFGNLDLSNSRKIKFELYGMSDADLSSIVIYYLNENDEQINLVNLPHRDQINSTKTIEIDNPQYSGEILLRLTLKSSVCTGQIYHIELRDVKIYSIN